MINGFFQRFKCTLFLTSGFVTFLGLYLLLNRLTTMDYNV
jgi:hypothetical protein